MFFRAALPDLFKIICQSKIRRVRKQHRHWNKNTNSLQILLETKCFVGQFYINMFSVRNFICRMRVRGFVTSPHPSTSSPWMFFSVHLLLLLNLPTCVCQRAFFDDKIWIDYKRMPSCEVYIKKKRREIWEVQTQEKHRAEENEKLEIDLNPLISVTFLPQLKASPKSAPFQFHTPSKLLSCEGGAPHVCI